MWDFGANANTDIREQENSNIGYENVIIEHLGQRYVIEAGNLIF